METQVPNYEQDGFVEEGKQDAKADDGVASQSAVYGGYEAGEFSEAGYRAYSRDSFPLSSNSDESGTEADGLHVQPFAGPKPYLGGFKNPVSGAQYHHAYTETADPRIRPHKWAGVMPGSRIERDTQTSVAVTRSIQSYRECGAQTARRDLHHDAALDKVVIPRPYITADEVMEVRHAQAVRIQCAVRCALARAHAASLRAERNQYRQSVGDGEDAAAVAGAQEAARDAARRANPRTAEDFAVLYDEIETWRCAEIARIDSEAEDARTALEAVRLPPMASLNGPELHDQREVDLKDILAQRHLALAAVVLKEQRLCGKVDVLRCAAAKHNAVAKSEGNLAAMAAPVAWARSGAWGETTSVITPFAARAGQLKSLYDALGSSLAREERLDLLLHVKYTVREFETALTREISALLDREVDLMQRGRPASSLAALRVRVRNLFLAFIETPEFNPACAKYVRAPGGPLGPLQGSADVTGRGGMSGSSSGAAPWSTGTRAASSASAVPLMRDGRPAIAHPTNGTTRDPRILAVPTFMRPKLRRL